MSVGRAVARGTLTCGAVTCALASVALVFTIAVWQHNANSREGSGNVYGVSHGFGTQRLQELVSDVLVSSEKFHLFDFSYQGDAEPMFDDMRNYHPHNGETLSMKCTTEMDTRQAGNTPGSNDGYEFPWREPEPWDIEKDLEHSRTLELNDITSGTWMALDLSPDGQTIVFDLLGDLYTLPITGGQATLLKGGVSWDTQPQFSRDGSELLYASDEGGCDNMWIMDLNNIENRRPVSNETYRYVGNGMYHPTEDRIVGVKRFTTSRSLGGGELWFYDIVRDPDVASPDGTQLIGRESVRHQMGPEEPFWSPDGKYVYFSQNDFGVVEWEYSKDPHAGIYDIRRIDVETRRVEVITGGSGGAARPVLSHSGRYMAFVRRRVLDTALLIRDLETGNELVVTRELSRDQQTSFSNTGVYPRFAWTADDSEIIAWAKGKLVRINVSTGAITEIQFEVDSVLQLTETVRADVDAAAYYDEGSFNVKVVQTAVVTPDHSTVIFNAVGHTYRASLLGANIQPVRLTTRTDFEFMPSIKTGSGTTSGEWLAQVVWNDVSLAQIEVIHQTTGESFIEVDGKGRYADPYINRDNTLLYTRLGLDGARVSGVEWGTKTSGIYVKQLSLGTPSEGRYVCSGNTAEFDYMTGGLIVYQGTTAVLVDHRVEPATQQVLVRTSFASEVRLQTLERRYAAFVQLRQIYLADLAFYDPDDDGSVTLTARPVDATGAMHPGLIRISEFGGQFLRWSEDGQYLRWLLGAEFFEININELLSSCGTAWVSADGEYPECVRRATKTFDLSFPVSSSRNDDCVAFTNAQILTMEDGEGEEPTPGSTIVAVGALIHAIGRDGTVDVPPTCQIFDAEGGLLIPGYIDAHAHFSGSNRFYVQQNWEYVTNLAFGVTSNHNPSKDTVQVFADSELVKSGMIIGPRIYSTGTIVYGAESGARIEVNNVEDATQVLKNLQAYGAFSAKVYQQPTRASKQRTIVAARELGMSLVPEGGIHFAWDTSYLVDGITTIEHNNPVSPLYEDVVRLHAASGTAYTPTFVVNFGQMSGEHYWYQNTNVWEDERLMRFSPNRAIEQRALRPVHQADIREYDHIDVSKAVNAINELGGIVELGAHGQRQGLAFHWEIWMLEQGGMSNARVLRAATVNGAKCVGLKRIGSLEVGHVADFIVYPPDKSPLDNIRNTEFVRYTATDGKVYDASTMDQLFPERKPLPEGPQLDIREL